MTKKLEEILNLPNVQEAFAKVDKKQKDADDKEKTVGKNLDPKTQEALTKTYEEFDKISRSLPQVKGLGELSDLELDKLAMEAEDSYKNLMDLGMNVDSRYSGRIFEVASTSNKIDIKGAVEKLFSVKVKAVNIINIKGKVKRFKGVLGKRNDIKKAVITLEEGNTIDISAGV